MYSTIVVGAELLADLGEVGVDRVRQRRGHVDVAELLAAGVRERHAAIGSAASRPLSTLSGVNSPESSAAAAVTTFIVDPGG